MCVSREDQRLPFPLECGVEPSSAMKDAEVAPAVRLWAEAETRHTCMGMMACNLFKGGGLKKERKACNPIIM